MTLFVFPLKKTAKISNNIDGRCFLQNRNCVSEGNNCHIFFIDIAKK